MNSIEPARLEGVWVDAKQNKYFYVSNKVLSISLAAMFAFVTIHLRSQNRDFDSLCPSENYKFLFWLLFVFYSMQALDELLELYNVLADIADKGILGMLFELNYFTGIFITGKVLASVYRSPQCY